MRNFLLTKTQHNGSLAAWSHKSKQKFSFSHLDKAEKPHLLIDYFDSASRNSITRKMKVCLSYSSQDKEEVRKLAKDLRWQGAQLLLDEWETRVDQRIKQKFQARLAKCDYLGIWLTVKSVKEKWVEREWIATLQEGVREGSVLVLPLLAENCDVPMLFQDRRLVDFRSGYRIGLNALFSTLYPNQENYIRSLTNIKRKTTYLWQELSFLPVNNAKEVFCEIKGSSLDTIVADLSNLSTNGNYFQWLSVVDYKMNRETIHSITITNISDDLLPLIDIVCKENRSSQGIIVPQ